MYRTMCFHNPTIVAIGFVHGAEPLYSRVSLIFILFLLKRHMFGSRVPSMDAPYGMPRSSFVGREGTRNPKRRFEALLGPKLGCPQTTSRSTWHILSSSKLHCTKPGCDTYPNKMHFHRNGDTLDHIWSHPHNLCYLSSATTQRSFIKSPLEVQHQLWLTRATNRKLWVLYKV